jgi:hypothetical protein
MDLAQALRLAPADVPHKWLETDGFILPEGTIGLCTRAGDWDPERSISARFLAPLARTRPCLSLDLGPSPLPVLNPGGCPADMAATAALIAGCAVVVTVDTMIAHLAGSLGKPMILLLKHDPDWRWNPASDRSDWYPGAKVMTQSAPGDWAALIPRIVEALT